MKKRFLFFFVHPAKFHLFKHTINKLKSEGHTVDILIISKDILEDLLKSENWEYKNLFPKGRKVKFLPQKLVAVFSALLTVLKLCNYLLFRKRYDKFITDDILVINGFFMRIPTYFFVDNDYSAMSLGKYLLPFATKIIAPDSTFIGEKYSKKKISFKGNKAIAHLTPDYFTPDRNVIGIKENYFLVRVAELNAVHDDENNRGIIDASLDRLINLLNKHGKILISAERVLADKYEQYRLNINPKDISHYLAFAKMVVTDSGTMATEAAVLGVPNILLNNLASKCGVHVDLRDNYDLQYYYDNFEAVYEKAKVLLQNDNLNIEWKERKEIFLKNADDFPKFLHEQLIKNENE